MGKKVNVLLQRRHQIPYIQHLLSAHCFCLSRKHHYPPTQRYTPHHTSIKPAFFLCILVLRVSRSGHALRGPSCSEPRSPASSLNSPTMSCRRSISSCGVVQREQCCATGRRRNQLMGCENKPTREGVAGKQQKQSSKERL